MTLKGLKSSRLILPKGSSRDSVSLFSPGSGGCSHYLAHGSTLHCLSYLSSVTTSPPLTLLTPSLKKKVIYLTALGLSSAT